MLRILIPCCALLIAHAHAIGFANGVKIGEATDTSVVLWTRLTEAGEAANRTDNWTAENPNWTVPGLAGEVRFTYGPDDESEKLVTDWLGTSADDDFCRQVRLEKLKPGTRYEFITEGRSGDRSATVSGSFTTAPAAKAEAPVRFAVSTCQEFETRDDMSDGHKIYRSMAAFDPAFFVQTGDTVYYDRKQPLSKSMPLARYRWHRMYSLPSLRDFHLRVPSYWMHDDHDILKDDCFPGQTYGELTWDQGLKIWREQIPQSEKPYRTFRWGRDLQIWLPEGREFRSSNKMPDGPEKSILGEEQWAWLEKSMRESDATFKVYVSATPVVGPDRGGKNDNHANSGFTHEGERLRKLLSEMPGCFVINGDRHWQYHSVDSETGLNEFGCGASTDKHAGGWNQNDKRPEHRFLRVKGGFAGIEVGSGEAVFTHYDVDGRQVYRATIPKP